MTDSPEKIPNALPGLDDKLHAHNATNVWARLEMNEESELEYWCKLGHLFWKIRKCC
jgi:hypothetical protein